MKPLLTILLLIAADQSFSQTKYVKGHIVTLANDTIVGYVPAASSFGEVVPFKKKQDGNDENMPLSNIRSLTHSSNVFENVAFEMDDEIVHKLMWLKVEGKLNLYLEVVVTAKSSGFSTRGNANTHEWRLKTYVLSKAGSTEWIANEDFIETLTPFISDNAGLLQKVNNGTYKFEDIETVVKIYNGTKEPQR